VSYEVVHDLFVLEQLPLLQTPPPLYDLFAMKLLSYCFIKPLVDNIIIHMAWTFMSDMIYPIYGFVIIDRKLACFFTDALSIGAKKLSTRASPLDGSITSKHLHCSSHF